MTDEEESWIFGDDEVCEVDLVVGFGGRGSVLPVGPEEGGGCSRSGKGRGLELGRRPVRSIAIASAVGAKSQGEVRGSGR